MAPFFSIITATRNAGVTLPSLLRSLAEQTCKDFELVLQDGNSTDDTVAQAESYRDKLPSLNIRSEPDTGIYDAWNRALDRVSGEWVLFLGADDVLAGPDVLEMVAMKLQPASEEILFAPGDSEVVAPDGTVQYRYVGRVESVRETLRSRIPFGHPALFHRTSLFRKERLDTSFRISGDYEFLCRTWQDDRAGLWLDLIVTRIAVGGISSRIGNTLTFHWEIARVILRHFFGIWTPVRLLLEMVKGVGKFALWYCLGTRRAAILINRSRAIRDLPPAWAGEAGSKDKRSPA